MGKSDTIAAVATAMGNSGLNVIRVSGSESFQIADKIFKSVKKEKRLVDQPAYTIHYGNIVDQDEILDEVIVLLMRAPHSFTAEDTVEINCHGGVFVTKKILHALIRHGARPAEPGEFTKRAFLNGRIDLTQAEAVMDVIQAKNEYALKSSMSQLKGSVLKKIRSIREKILYEIAFIESALDDPEHISLEGYPHRLGDNVDNLLKIIKNLLINFDQGRIIREGIRTVIIGKPNAGKSSLLNALAGNEKAIVTDIAGTTRDILEEQIQIRSLSLQIADTAGIRNTEDLIERIGVERAKENMKDADLVLYVVDSSTVLDENDEEIISLLKDRKTIVLLNKIDMSPVTTKKMVEKRFEAPIVCISAKEEKGFEEFADLLEKMFFVQELSYNDEVYLTNIRQRTALEIAQNSLFKVKESIFLGMPEDFYSIDLMDAYESLGSILGESVSDDLVNEIFNKFCMGK